MTEGTTSLAQLTKMRFLWRVAGDEEGTGNRTAASLEDSTAAVWASHWGATFRNVTSWNATPESGQDGGGIIPLNWLFNI